MASPFVKSLKEKPGIKYADCSGFTAWCLGYDRVQNLGLSTEKWYSTTEIYNDSLQLVPQMFTRVPMVTQILAGDIIVYPSSSLHRYGHIGVISRVLPGFVRLGRRWWTHLAVTHCSTGGKNAIRTSDAKLWKDREGVILRYKHFNQEGV